MKYFSLFFVANLLLGCISENNNSEVAVSSILSDCENGQLPKAAGADVGKILFSSKDSLQFELGVTVACKGTYEESAEFPNDTTVKIAYKYENSATGCVCRKKATIALSFTEVDLGKIRWADFNGRIYRLEASAI